jgi:transcriptional regulator with XRE-family HTH domain
LRVLHTLQQSKIKEMRIERGFSQAQLARLLSTHRSTVCRWESGKSFPDENQLRMLMKFLGEPALPEPDAFTAVRVLIADLSQRIARLEARDDQRL